MERAAVYQEHSPDPLERAKTAYALAQERLAELRHLRVYNWQDYRECALLLRHIVGEEQDAAILVGEGWSTRAAAGHSILIMLTPENLAPTARDFKVPTITGLELPFADFFFDMPPGALPSPDAAYAIRLYDQDNLILQISRGMPTCIAESNPQT